MATIRIIISAVLLLIAHVAMAQEPLSQDHWVKDIGTNVKVNDIAQDSTTGYIWLATSVGVFRFNGTTFTQIKDSLKKHATSLDAHNGEVYIGYKDGSIAQVLDNRLVWQQFYGATPSATITNIEVRSHEILWVCTEGQGIFIIVNNIGFSFDKSKGLSDNYVYGLSVMNDSLLMAATDNGINEIIIKNGRIKARSITTAKGLPDNIVRVVSPIPDICWSWIGMHEGGLALYCSNIRSVWTPNKGQPWLWGAVNDILPTSKTNAWVTTNDGYLLQVTLIDSATIKIEPKHFAGQQLKKVIIDNAGNIWCATNTGLKLVTSELLNNIKLPKPYDLKSVTAICYDKNNNFWYAQGNKLYCYNVLKPDKPKMIYQAPAIITALYNDWYNRIWIGTLGKGVMVREPKGKAQKVDGITPLSTESVLDITGTEKRIWIAGLHGVEELSYDGNGVRNVSLVKLHNKKTGIGSDYIYQLYADSKQRIWMATDGAGVCMYDGINYHSWDSATGMKDKVVYTITEDAYGYVWAATLNNGLIVYNGKEWRNIGVENGLRDNNISAITPTSSGQMVITHGKGIDVWYPRSLQFRHYDLRTGLGIDSVSSVLKLAAVDTSGNAYVPHGGGLLMFKNLEATYSIKPYVNISSLSLFFKRVPLSKKNFKYGENQVTFYFEGVNLSAPQLVFYRYKLEGYNDNWIVTNDKSVTFSQIPTGSYTFRVQASLNETFNMASQSSCTFSIAKPFWKEVWFFIVAGIFIWGIVYLYVRVRENNLRKYNKLQRERMMFEYEHLKSQVNPHFLFNSLNTLTSLIEDEQEAAVDYTVHLSDLYRTMLLFRDKDTITLAEEWSIVENYIYVQKSRFGEALILNADIPADVMKNSKIMPLALQLLVENAIKHNVVSLSKPLTISIVAANGVLTISNPIQEKISKEKGAGLGLINIRKRYKLLSGKDVVHYRKNGEFVVILPLL